MTTPKPALSYLLKYAGLTTSFVQPLKRELDKLIQANAADQRNISKAANLLLKMLPKLGPTLHCSNYGLDAIRMAVEAIRPYAKEAKPGDIPTLLPLLSLEFPLGVHGLPPLTLSDEIWALWSEGRTLRTVDRLKESAAAKGLCLVENESGPDKGYVVFNGDILVAKNRVYRYVSNFIENCRPAQNA